MTGRRRTRPCAWTGLAAYTWPSRPIAAARGVRHGPPSTPTAPALDSQDRPRLAYHAPLAAGFGLYYAWCDTGCTASGQNWHNQEIEPSEQVNAELPIPPAAGCPFPQCNPPVPACTVSFWDTGVRPSLALDSAGHPRLAYDADHHQGGACGTFIDTHLTRFALFNQP